MTFTFTGKLNGIDNFNKIKIIVNDPKLIINKINDITNPYHYTDNGLECYIIPVKHKDYYLQIAETRKIVTVTVTIKRYSFNGKKGTSLILKQLDIIE